MNTNRKVLYIPICYRFNVIDFISFSSIIRLASVSFFSSRSSFSSNISLSCSMINSFFVLNTEEDGLQYLSGCDKSSYYWLLVP